MAVEDADFGWILGLWSANDQSCEERQSCIKYYPEEITLYHKIMGVYLRNIR